jgi:demethylmenaquinone methyltransferase / 2-methoxy-6-polyprenyl-1,4-benzoquinol methylase
MDRLASEERADIAPPVFPRYGPARKGQSGMQNGGETHFGYQSIPLEEKQGRVDDVFHSVARRYDLMNDLMSGGLHRLWKDALVTAVNPPKRTRPFKLLDLAGGTGDVAFRVAEAGGPNTRVAVCDINAEMLAVGADRAEQRGLDAVVTFEQANAEELPYADRTFDCVTIAFGIRNMPRVERALSEAFRVLKIGGRFLCLEFSSVDVPGLDKLYELYSFQAIPRIGQVVTGDRQAYQYLVESIRKFPRAKAFAGMIERAGFRRVSFRAMTGGVVALHSGWKL